MTLHSRLHLHQVPARLWLQRHRPFAVALPASAALPAAPAAER